MLFFWLSKRNGNQCDFAAMIGRNESVPSEMHPCCKREIATNPQIELDKSEDAEMQEWKISFLDVC